MRRFALVLVVLVAACSEPSFGDRVDAACDRAVERSDDKLFDDPRDWVQYRIGLLAGARDEIADIAARGDDAARQTKLVAQLDDVIDALEARLDDDDVGGGGDEIVTGTSCDDV